MIRIPVSSLKEGQKFSKPVFLDDNSLFAPENVAIRKKDIALLNSLEILDVYTEGALIEGAKPVSPVEKSAQDVTQKITGLIKQLDAIFQAIRNLKAVNVRALWQITAVILQVVKTDRPTAVGFILGNSVEGYAMAKSSINTAILSALIGMEMKFAPKQLPEVVAGALLHDVGMLRIPPQILQKQGGLTQEEAQIIASHPIGSYQIIGKELLYPDSVCQIAVQHHERWDGTGYPQRLAGKMIVPGALIVSVADAFEAMVCKKSYRNSLTGYQAMKNLVSENAAHFSPEILKVFIKIMGIYPIGSCVQLSDGRMAKVIDLNPAIPLRPVVRIITEGADAGGETIDLLHNKQLYITKGVDLQNGPVQA